MAKSRGQHCGDIELTGYLANASGPVSLVLDLRIDRFGSSSDRRLNRNGHLHYPNDIDRSLNEAAVPIASTSGRFLSEFVRLYSYRMIGELTSFLQLQEFSLRNITVVSSTSTVWSSPHTLS